jgi:hypothetical protein
MNTIETKSNFTRFAEACRYNSGKALCDSGDAYGRHWQQPAIEPDRPAVALDVSRFAYKGEDRTEVSATIETAHFLDANFDVLADVQDRFDAWVEEQPDGESWFELGQRFADEELGLHTQARDNVYNGENDLSQVFIWEVFTPEEKPSDWLYADDAVAVIHVHTGCDVRGGYSYPLFCRSKGEYATAVDFVAGFDAFEGTDEDGEEISHEDLQRISEHWQVGYSGHPESQVNDDIAEVIGEPEGDTFTARLKTGETVKIQAVIPYV